MTTKKTIPTVHVSRPLEPQQPYVSDELKLKHARSIQSYPQLNLSENEYVVAVVKRHKIGLFVPLILGVSLMIFTALVALAPAMLGINMDTTSQSVVSLMAFLFIIMLAVVIYFYAFIYTNNRFYLTNECVIQNIQIGPFSKKEQSISLSSVEDASYEQMGIVSQIFNFGTIRLSTVGDEHTYTFTYVEKPDYYRDMLHNAVESFKNGRPVEDVI